MRTQRKLFAWIMAFILTLSIIPTTALADEPKTIDDEISWNGSNDLFLPAGATLTVDAQITISGNVTVLGGGTIKRGENYNGALIYVPTGAAMTLQNITVDGGATWNGDTAEGLTAEEAAIRVEGGEVTLGSGAVIQNNNHVSIRDNSYNYLSGTPGTLYTRYYNMGGGIAVYGGTLTMNSGSQIINNAVTNIGYKADTTKNEGNSDSLGGGVAVYENGTFIMNGGEISGNQAAVSNSAGRAYGGGVGLITRGANSGEPSTPDTHKITFAMNGGSISGNSAYSGGGGIYGSPDQGDAEADRYKHLDMTIAGEVSGNTSSAGGGGVQVGSANLIIGTTAEIVSNTAKQGGGILIGSLARFTMNGGTIAKNKAISGVGGGIYINVKASAATPVINGGEISENQATSTGGGIQIGTDLTVEIRNCSITDNSCSNQNASGGGICANPGVTLTISDCTITGNASKGGHGGGLYISGAHGNIPGSTTFGGTVIIDQNTSSLTGPNLYVNSIEANIMLSELTGESKIGVAWNSNGTPEEGKAVIQNVTPELFNCIVCENVDNYVLRQDAEASTAVLKKAIIITLRLNDPNIESSEGHLGEATAVVKTLPGEEVYLADLEAAIADVEAFQITGYEISGWGKNRVGQENWRYDFPCTFDTAANIYALWTPKVYSITYELNGGALSEDAPKNHTYTQETQLIAPTYESYEFDGWYTDSTFETKVETLGAEAYSDDITLYAKWVKTVDGITYFVNSTVAEQTYNGTPIIPEVTVINNETSAEIDKESYSVECADSSNINVGTANLVVKVGETVIGTVSFEIVPAVPQIQLSDKTAAYTGSAIAVDAAAVSGVSVGDVPTGQVTYTYYSDEACTKALTGIPSAVGVYYVKAAIAADGNYTAAESNVAKLTIESQTTGGSSSGGSSSSSTTTVSVTSSKNGTVSASPKNAKKDDTVTLTVKPNAGYELDELTVTDKNGKTVKVTEGKNGKFTFTMPATKVTVEATFSKIEEAQTFIDVPNGYWAEDAIAWAYENGYMNGNSAVTFNPEGTVTRQQLWMILARLSGYQPADFTEAKAWAVDNGISDGTIPGNAVSRQQLVTILYRYAVRMGYNTTAKADLTQFPDHTSVASYATDAMAWSVANGIVGGTTQGTLNPAGTATRAQFAVILNRFHDKMLG